MQSNDNTINYFNSAAHLPSLECRHSKVVTVIE